MEPRFKVGDIVYDPDVGYGKVVESFNGFYEDGKFLVVSFKSRKHTVTYDKSTISDLTVIPKEIFNSSLFKIMRESDGT